MIYRFLHTGDWQLGMKRHYFSEGVQERYTQARFDAVRALGRIAEQEQCRFMLVCGDMFESNQVDRGTVARALEALREVRVPVYILPGNHDPLDAACVYNSSTFVDRQAANIHVIRNEEPFRPIDGLELVGAPWLSKRPAVNPATEVMASLSATDVPRVLAAHGMVDTFNPEKDDPRIITAADLDAAISAGKLTYAAVGDRHSATSIGNSGQAWYAGTPEATDAGEVRSGFALVVDIDGSDNKASVREVPVGNWQFIREEFALDTIEDIKSLADWLAGLENKETTVLKLDLGGSITLTENTVLHEHIDAATDVFAAVIVNDDKLMVAPDDQDFADMGFSGFAGRTVDQLRATIDAGGPEATAARQALMLMMRLSRSGE